jgi:PAT family beta-lactamase induction signal transducer AmpG
MMAIGAFSPTYPMSAIIAATFMIAVFSATQDIALDAYRRELLPDRELGLGNSFFVNAYRMAGLIPGGLSLILADTLSWPWVFITTALFMIPGIICAAVIQEPAPTAEPPRTLRDAVIEPFHEFFARRDLRFALLTLAFLLLYKFGDSLATAQLTSFYIDKGFSNTQIGTVAKLVGFWSMIVGGFLGGLIMVKIGINRALWLFGALQLLSILGFAWLSVSAMNVYYLGLAVGFEYLGVGLGTTAFVAFIASLTNKNFSATQFALFSSFFAIPRSVTGIIAGILVEKMGLGWTTFFLISALTALPGIALLFWVAPWEPKILQRNGETAA